MNILPGNGDEIKLKNKVVLEVLIFFQLYPVFIFPSERYTLKVQKTD